jgi:hypothetical protein
VGERRKKVQIRKAKKASEYGLTHNAAPVVTDEEGTMGSSGRS